MRIINPLLIIIFISLVLACGSEYPGIPVKYHSLLDSALNNAGNNSQVLKRVLDKARKGEREAAAFLIAYMPEKDLDTLSEKFILDQVEWAYKARNEFNWCSALPDSVFFNEVLAYYTLDERRDNWREDFYRKFSPLVKNCKTVYEAIDSVNIDIRKILQVEYNTKRSKVNISPFKAIEEKMATCTGLSFLLIDAFRSLGIPSRLAGTPMWTNMRGNHSWVEVWIDGKWYFTEYYPDKLNKSWFVADAGKADPENPEHWIYATSYKPAETSFPLVWNRASKEIHACNVTDRYIRLYQEQLEGNELKSDELIVNIVLYKDQEKTDLSEGRVSEKVSVTDGGKVIDFGYTPGPTDDLNRFLKFRLKRNYHYAIMIDRTGEEPRKNDITTGVQSEERIKLYRD
jgi:transglutaminase-like putative cysteine protease